jgi:hypothetical protein
MFVALLCHRLLFGGNFVLEILAVGLAFPGLFFNFSKLLLELDQALGYRKLVVLSHKRFREDAFDRPLNTITFFFN